jgi:hypothetical protein
MVTTLTFAHSSLGCNRNSLNSESLLYIFLCSAAGKL